ncbi:MAG: heparinase II/III domain-containing protein, partial [Planctomycetota bacterium]
NYLTFPGESHDGRLIAYLTDMSLAMAGETPDAETWLTYSLKALLTFYPHWAGIDGGWAEGTPYGLWYNTFYIPAFESLRQLADYDLWQRPFFNNVRYFFFYCMANHGEIRPFGDAAESGGPGVRGGSGYAEFMSFHAHRYNDPYVGWWVKQVPGYRGQKDGFGALLHADELPAKTPSDLPNSRLFKGVGWAGLHSDITRPKDDTCLIFKSSPYGSVSHSHADQNAFAIMKGGTALAIPSGYYGPSYGKPHHAQWTRSTKANNCILVNGQGQKIRVADGGAIVDFKDAAGYSYVAGDATPAYAGKLNKWVRRILFLRPGLFLLLDEIEAPAASQYQWMLHAFEKMTIDGAKVTSRRKAAVLDVTLACPQGLILTQTDLFDTPYNHGIPKAYHREKANHWHVTAETGKSARKTRIAAVMSVYGAKERFDVHLVEGWIRFDQTDASPPSPGAEDISHRVDIWGRSRDGEIFRV